MNITYQQKKENYLNEKCSEIAALGIVVEFETKPVNILELDFIQELLTEENDSKSELSL